MKKNPFSAKALPLYELFNGFMVEHNIESFLIPQYQRFYSWKPKHVKDLLSDIAMAITDNEDGFFLGPILLSNSPESQKSISIVDGQQRIITTSLILGALMHHVYNLKQENNEVAMRCLWDLPKELTDIAHISPGNIPTKLSFSLENDDTSYQLMICDNQAYISGPIKKAYESINAFFAGYSYEDTCKYINYLTNKVFFVAIKPDEHVKQINKIFETLNDRGMPLNQIELFKNFALSYFSPRDKKFDLFEKLYMWLNTVDSVERYLAVYSMLHYDYKTVKREKNLYRLWKNRIYEYPKSERKSQMRIILDDLSSSLEYYQAISKEGSSLWMTRYKGAAMNDDRMLAMIQFLSKYKITHPILFAIVKREPGYKVLKSCYHIIYSLLARVWLIHSLSRAGNLEEILTTVALGINKKEIELSPDNLYKNIVKQAGSHYTDITDDKLFSTKLGVIEYPGNVDPRTKFIFTEIVNSNQKEIKIMREDTLKVSHVLPRDEGELSDWGDFPLVDYLTSRHKLGNMVLLNGEAPRVVNSQSFKEKKKIFAESDFDITKNISLVHNWGPQEIQQKQKEYAQQITQILSLPS